jgi:hypothetical protein
MTWIIIESPLPLPGAHSHGYEGGGEDELVDGQALEGRHRRARWERPHQEPVPAAPHRRGQQHGLSASKGRNNTVLDFITWAFPGEGAYVTHPFPWDCSEVGRKGSIHKSRNRL